MVVELVKFLVILSIAATSSSSIVAGFFSLHFAELVAY